MILLLCSVHPRLIVLAVGRADRPTVMTTARLPVTNMAVLP